MVGKLIKLHSVSGIKSLFRHNTTSYMKYSNVSTPNSGAFKQNRQTAKTDKHKVM